MNHEWINKSKNKNVEMEMNIIGFALILLITTWCLGHYKEYDKIENVWKATEYDLLTPTVLDC